MNNLPNLPFNLNNFNTGTGVKVNLGEQKVNKSFPAKTISASEIDIIKIIDLYSEKKVIAYCKLPLGIVTLWEGAAYDAIGQWTDQDVRTRILEIVNNI